MANVITHTLKELRAGRTGFLLMLMLMIVCFPCYLEARKIELTKYISYKGNLDNEDMPNGKGKMEMRYQLGVKISYTNTREERKDIVSGWFDKGMVRDAKLQLEMYNGPLWINSGLFKGTMTYRIQPDGGIIYNLIDGEYMDIKHTKIIISPDNPLVIYRRPFDYGCKTQSGLITRLESTSVPNDFAAPIPIDAIGIVNQANVVCYYKINDKFELMAVGKDHTTIQFEDGYVLTKSKDTITVSNNEGDYFKYVKGQTYAYRKCLSDGLLSYSGGDFAIFTTNSQKNWVVVPLENMTTTTKFLRVMKSDSLQDTQFKVFKEDTVSYLAHKHLEECLENVRRYKNADYHVRNSPTPYYLSREESEVFTEKQGTCTYFAWGGGLFLWYNPDHLSFGYPWKVEGNRYKATDNVTYKVSQRGITIEFYHDVQLTCDFDRNGHPKARPCPYHDMFGCNSGTRTENATLIIKGHENISFKAKVTCKHSKYQIRAVRGTGQRYNRSTGKYDNYGNGGDPFGPWKYMHNLTINFSFDDLATAAGMNKKEILRLIVSNGINAIETPAIETSMGHYLNYRLAGTRENQYEEIQQQRLTRTALYVKNTFEPLSSIIAYMFYKQVGLSLNE